MELYQALITLDGWTFLAQICNLMIQLVIFKKFLLKPIKQVIADRKAKADSEIADAQKLRTEAEAMKAEYEQNLQNARAEANQIVANAQKTAAARSEELLGEARAQAAAMFARFMDLDEADDDDDDDDDLPEYVYVDSDDEYHYDKDCAGKNATKKKRTTAEKKYDACTKCVD